MPRRTDRNHFAIQLGQRLRVLRMERKMPLEQMAWGSGFLGKCSLVETENRRSVPSVSTLGKIAQVLGLSLADVFAFSKESLRDQVIDITRDLSDDALAELLAHAEQLLPKK